MFKNQIFMDKKKYVLKKNAIFLLLEKLLNCRRSCLKFVFFFPYNILFDVLDFKIKVNGFFFIHLTSIINHSSTEC